MSYAQYCRLNVPVGASAKTVVRKAHRMLNHDARRDSRWRAERHDWLRGILREHRAARAIFRKFA